MLPSDTMAGLSSPWENDFVISTAAAAAAPPTWTGCAGRMNANDTPKKSEIKRLTTAKVFMVMMMLKYDVKLCATRASGMVQGSSANGCCPGFLSTARTGSVNT